MWIDDLSLGDKDRPETQFDTQKSHTVAWTLLRAELRSFRAKPLAVLLDRLRQRFGELAELAEELRAAESNAKVSGAKLTERNNRQAAQILSAKLSEAVMLVLSLTSARLPLYVWQTLAADFVRLYVQAYQVSKAATFKDGAAKGHGEAAHMRMLRADVDAVAAGETLDEDQIQSSAYSAARMLDYKFTTALKPRALAYAVQHWVRALCAVFPKLMAAHGAKLVAGVLDAKLKGASQNLLKNGTVRDLVEHFYGPEALKISASGSGDLPLPAPAAIAQLADVRIPLPDALATGFTVLADLAPDYSGSEDDDQRHGRRWRFGPEWPR